MESNRSSQLRLCEAKIACRCMNHPDLICTGSSQSLMIVLQVLTVDIYSYHSIRICCIPLLNLLLGKLQLLQETSLLARDLPTALKRAPEADVLTFKALAVRGDSRRHPPPICCSASSIYDQAVLRHCSATLITDSPSSHPLKKYEY